MVNKRPKKERTIVMAKQNDECIEYWKERFRAEREKVAGYEQIAKMHSAYITILLKKLGATKDNMITITAGEVKEAMEHHEARAVLADNGCSLYCEVTKE